MKVHMNWRTGFLVVIWFLVGVIIFAITTDWQIVAAIATWLLAGGLIFAILQVQQARRTTNAQIAVQLFSKLRDPKTKTLLRDTIYELNPEETESLTGKLKIAVDELFDWLDMLGALVDKKIIDEQLAIEGFGGGPAVLRCWYQLARYIRKEQEERGFYADNYEDFVSRTLRHFDDTNIRVALHSKTVNIDNLVKEFKKDELEKLRPRRLKEIRQARKINKNK